MKKNLLDLDLQLFAEGEDVVEDAGENDVADVADPQEDDDSDVEDVDETGEDEGDAEPHQQTAEENAQFAAMRRRAEADARKQYAPVMDQLEQMNQQVVAMCQGVTHPVTGQPISNVFEYWDALRIQRQKSNEQELQDKGVDPQLIKRMVASDPTVLQAQAVMQRMQSEQANLQIQREVEELSKIDPSIKSIDDIRNAPYKDELLQYCALHNATLTDAFKVLNYGNQGKAARQQAINEMRGKSHLNSQSTGVAGSDDVSEVPAEIMARMKADGKTEKQIRDLYKKVAGKLHLN